MTTNSPSNQPLGPEHELQDIRAELARLQAENAGLKAVIELTQQGMESMQEMPMPEQMQLQGVALSRIALAQPGMPTLHRNGYIEYPAMEQSPYLQNPNARQFKEYMCNRDRTVNRFRTRSANIARARMERYNYVPSRQAQKLPPVEGATRTRYIRGKGLFTQVYTITGPDNGWEDRGIIKSYDEVRAKGEARARAREAEIASEQQRYEAAGKLLKRWNEGSRDSAPFIREENFAKYAGNDIDGNPIKPGYHGPTGTDIAHAAHVDRAVAEGGIPLHSGLEGNAVYIDRPDLPRPTAGGKDRAAAYRDYMGIPQPLPKPESKESRNARDRERALSLAEGLNKALEVYHTTFNKPVEDRKKLEAATGIRQERKQQNPEIAMEAVKMIDETLTQFDKLKNVLKPNEYERNRQSMLEQRQEWLEEWEQKQVQIVMRALRAGRTDKADELIKLIEEMYPKIHGAQENPRKAFIENNIFQLDRRDIPYSLWIDPNKSKNGTIKLFYHPNKNYKTGRKPGE